MALSSYERAALVRLRDMQLQRREAEVAWDRFVPVDTSLGPALDVKYSKLDKKVDVTRWRTGNPRLGSVDVAVGTDTFQMGFYGVELTESWWENWLKTNMVKEPNAAVFDFRSAFDMRRLEQIAVAEIERSIETDFWGGVSEWGWSGMKTLAGTPTSLAQDLSTEAGRQEFLATLTTIKATAKNPGGDDRRVVGQLRLAIDSQALEYFDELYDLSSGNQRTAREYLAMKLGGDQNIIPIENAALADMAILHYADTENIVAFDGTPEGVVLARAGDANRGEDAHTRIFYNVGWNEFRDGSAAALDGLLPP